MVWKNAVLKYKAYRMPLLLTAALFFLCACAAVLAPPSAQAAGVDYEELQEDPLDTAFRKLKSTGGLEWDEQEIVAGPAPAIIKGMIWPLKNCKVGGLFNTNRGGHRHTGVDLLAPQGSPIMAVLPGVVEIVSNGKSGFRGYGNVALINHNNQLWTLYSHCATLNVRVGQKEKQGEVIATVGHTGRATANHLHFEVRGSNGAPLNPLKYLPKNPFAYDKR